MHIYTMAGLRVYNRLIRERAFPSYRRGSEDYRVVAMLGATTILQNARGQERRRGVIALHAVFLLRRKEEDCGRE